MPKFIYTVILTNLVFLGLTLRTIFFRYPDSTQTKMSFLLFLGFWLFLTLSLILFFFNKKKPTAFLDPKKIYRKGLGRSITVTIGIIGFLALKFFDLLNLLTGGLLLLLFITLFVAITSNKR
jgi:hypothetical protein